MPVVPADERAYFQRRLREEIARCRRYRDVFCLVTLVARPTPEHPVNRRTTAVAARLIERRLRTSDVVDIIHEDAVAVLLIGTPAGGLGDAELRIRAALATVGGSWELRKYAFPEHEAQIASLELLAVA